MNFIQLEKAVQSLAKRGPDFRDSWFDHRIAMGHTRLSIIDTSSAGNQPMTDATGKWKIVYNGEIYNFRELRYELVQKGYQFKSQSDTEVLLNLYIDQGTKAFERLNGFFALALYNLETGDTVLARDQMGIKPLYFYKDDDKLIFGSELKALMAFNFPKKPDPVSVAQYFTFTYLPGKESILQKVEKLPPGTFMEIRGRETNISSFQSLRSTPFSGTYQEAQSHLLDLMNDAVQRRLVADVPVGTFLSGGIDSSIISALSIQYKPDLQTFSIGFPDNPFFDESHFASSVAKKIGSNHTIFPVRDHDLQENIQLVLDYLDEPFADSSSLPVYLLSALTKKKVTTILSGDGADELFAGYNKHLALTRAISPGSKERLIKSLAPLWQLLPGSRYSPAGNLVRKLRKFSDLLKTKDNERLWFLAAMNPESTVLNWMSPDFLTQQARKDYLERKSTLLKSYEKGSLHEQLQFDQQIVLPGDMLTKVDRMSMANALEVRVPFLDHRVVAFANSLPENMKIGNGLKKRILQDTFKHYLPDELYGRSKKGFEVPLLSWFKGPLKTRIMDDWLSQSLIEKQGYFNWSEIKKLRKKLYSANPGDIQAILWSFIVFQEWWNKNLR